MSHDNTSSDGTVRADPQSQSPSIVFTPRGPIAELTLNRPERKNALGPAEWQQLAAHLRTIAAESQLRAVLLRGAGGAFSSGGDLRTMPERLEWPVAQRQAQLLRDAQVIRQLHELDKPVVALIEGPCMGAGLALALACDLRICATTATLGAVFHRVGLTGDFGLSWLLPRIVGSARAMQLLMTAEVLDGARAEAIGLVHQALPAERAEAEARALCERLAAGPPFAQTLTKRALHRSLSTDLGGMLEWEAHAQSLAGKTADAREGVQAFLEKRKPVFRGQ